MWEKTRAGNRNSKKGNTHSNWACSSSCAKLIKVNKNGSCFSSNVRKGERLVKEKGVLLNRTKAAQSAEMEEDREWEGVLMVWGNGVAVQSRDKRAQTWSHAAVISSVIQHLMLSNFNKWTHRVPYFLDNCDYGGKDFQPAKNNVQLILKPQCLEILKLGVTIGHLDQ
ncbi:SGNH/GDSL hydrolase family protein [Sesbania bispinosa]|nr:SGNH/GDSL hydrolase family protein [Sesbania bispinosa]